MTVLVDTGVLCADHDTSASRHSEASEALEAVYDGQYGQPYVSDYVSGEAVTLTSRRSGSIEMAQRLGQRIHGSGDFPEADDLLHVTPPEFFDAIDIFERHGDQQLSFTDATLTAQCRDRAVDVLLSFDGDLDGLVDRLDPAAPWVSAQPSALA